MKFVKKNKRVNVKLTLPKNLEFKVLGSMITELWDIPLAEGALTVLNEAGCNDLIRKVKLAVRYRSVTQLFKAIPLFQPRRMLELTGTEKENAQAFFALYQVGSFLKKYPFKGTDTRTPAIEKFIEADRLCSAFNDENHKALSVLNEKHPKFLGVVEEIRKDISELLGDNPNLDSVIEHAKHGPGVSLSRQYRKGCSTEYFKWSTLPYTLTQGASYLAKEAISTNPQWIGALDNWYRKTSSIPIGHPIDTSQFWQTVLKVVDCSRTTTVPKSFETDRTIAIEPLLNVFFQLGVDHVIRRRLLRRWGFDLNSQERNQVLAHEASVTGESVTVDLSMASDLISLKICEMFLPEAWYSLLLDLRCEYTHVLGIKHPLEKISSMGNGYTFALESLVFGALVRCSIRRTNSDRKCAVYGDDLIVPNTAYPYLQELISLCGFKLNTEKSYSTGPFRESCGKDYFLGYDVRPVFLKRRLRGVQDILYLHNMLFTMEHAKPWQWGVCLSKTIQMLRSYLPHFVRQQFFGPMSESTDTHLFSSRRLPRNKWNQRYYWQIQSKPMIFNRNTAYFFRKLMALPKQQPRRNLSRLPLEQRIMALFEEDDPILQKWDVGRRMNSGNAFDVTKRDKVQLCCTQVCLP